MVKFGRKIAGIALGVSLLGIGAAEAAVPPDALAVGGIEYGASESYVRSIYGAPREVETKFNPIYAGGRQLNGNTAMTLISSLWTVRFVRSRLVCRTACRRRTILPSVRM